MVSASWLGLLCPVDRDLTDFQIELKRSDSRDRFVFLLPKLFSE